MNDLKLNNLRRKLEAIEEAMKKEVVPLPSYNKFSDSEKKLLVKFCHEAPVKFLKEISSENVFFKTEDPPDVGALTHLSKEIWEKFLSCKQTDEQFNNKLLVWQNLNNCIKSELSGYGLFMAGSTLNGFGLQISDIDLSLVTTEIVEVYKNTCLEHLKKMAVLLSKCDNIDLIQIIEAKVPLIRFYEKKYNFYIDVNFNITSNLQNTHLLYCYSQVDWRVSPLVTIIKQWAKVHNILDAKYGSLSSYPLVLMVIHFLQAGVKPKILPSLQKCLEGKFESTVNCLDYLNKIEVPFTELYPVNKQSLGELLLQFFEYYEKFEFAKYVISIQEGDKILKSEFIKKFNSKSDSACASSYSSGYIFIEEPFNLTNVSQTVYKSATFQMIKSMFEKTYLLLKTTHKLSDILDKSLK